MTLKQRVEDLERRMSEVEDKAEEARLKGLAVELDLGGLDCRVDSIEHNGEQAR